MKKSLLFLATVALSASAFAEDSATEEYPSLWVTGALGNYWWAGPGDEGSVEGVEKDGIYTFTVDFQRHEWTNAEDPIEFKIAGKGWNPEIGGDVKITSEPTPVYKVGSGNNLYTYRTGEQTLMFDYNNMTAWFAGENEADNQDRPGIEYGDVIYLIGAPQDWKIQESEGGNKMPLNKIGDGIYQGKYNIEAGKFDFRFYVVLGNWDQGSLGCQEADASMTIEFTDELFNGPVIEGGKGKWNVPNWEGGDVAMTVNVNDWTVNFAIGDAAGVESIIVNNEPKVIYNLQGVKVNPENLSNGIYIVNGKKVLIRK